MYVDLSSCVTPWWKRVWFAVRIQAYRWRCIVLHRQYAREPDGMHCMYVRCACGNAWWEFE